jgi:uncharacterized membrane protein YpjA
MPELLRGAIGRISGDRRLLAIIILINVAGSLFGLYYYWEQLMMTPWYLWLAVPDCPLYTFFMIFALSLVLLKRPSDTLNAITAVGLSMYGTWTVLVLLYFGEIYFAPRNALMSAGLWVSHLGMALEGFLLLPYLARVKPASWAITAIWFLALDAVDFFYQFTYLGLPMRTHPLAIMEYYVQGSPAALPLLEKIDTLLYVTFGLSIIFFIAMVALGKAYAYRPAEKKVIEKMVRS